VLSFFCTSLETRDILFRALGSDAARLDFPKTPPTMKKFYGLTGSRLNIAIAVIAGVDFALFGYDQVRHTRRCSLARLLTTLGCTRRATHSAQLPSILPTDRCRGCRLAFRHEQGFQHPRYHSWWIHSGMFLWCCCYDLAWWVFPCAACMNSATNHRQAICLVVRRLSSSAAASWLSVLLFRPLRSALVS
jgi:hypothetical protein